MNLKTLMIVLLSHYTGAGLFASLLIGAAVPALNVAGHAYIVVTWPALIYCTPKERNCDGMPPEWMAPYLFSMTFAEEK